VHAAASFTGVRLGIELPLTGWLPDSTLNPLVSCRSRGLCRGPETQISGDAIGHL
jgi:hypothetical protein